MNGPGPVWTAMVPAGQAPDDGLCVVSARHHTLTFRSGATALCATSGLWNVNLGYGNEAICEAVAYALRTLSYGGVFRYENTFAREAADRLLSLFEPGRFDRVIFSVSGGTANDLVMKLARQYQQIRGNSAKKLVVGLDGSYHGLTFGAHTLTGEDLGQRVYGMDTRLVRHVRPNDLEQLERFFAREGNSVAAFVVEPVLGSGAVVLTDDYLDRLFELRSRYGFVLAADEVATGYGRTGTMFASDRWQQPPDVLIASKGLTNGTVAASCVLAAPAISNAFVDVGATFVHAETQAGTAVSCAAMIATLDEMDRSNALGNVSLLASQLDEALAEPSRHRAIAGSRGVGAMRALAVHRVDGSLLRSEEVPGLVVAIRDAGAVVHPGPDGVQIFPAFGYDSAEVAVLFSAIDRGLAAYLDEPASLSGAVST